MAEKLMFGVTMEHMNNFDVFLFKLGIFTFSLFLVSVWPAFAKWTTTTHWGWFLGIFVICWIFVMRKLWKK
jgi:hypothetical protein